MKKINLLAIFIALVLIVSIINSSCKKDETSAAAVNIVQTDGNTFVTEDGATDTYNISLAAKPGADVQLNIQPDNQLTTSSAQFTFTPDNWNAAQIVTVAAVDDDIPESDHTGTITHASISNDNNYNAINIATLPSGANVAINSVNHTMNTGYYVDNSITESCASGSPFNPDDIEFDGFTTVLLATAILW